MLKLLLKSLSRILDCLPNFALGILGDVLGSVWFFLIPIRRSTVLANLGLAFPELSRFSRWHLAWRNYCHYGRSILEILRSLTWSKERYLSRTQIHGLENAAQFYEVGQGGFVLTLHLGNWEVLVGTGAAYGIPADMVVKFARSAFFEELLKWYRDRLGINVFLESGTAKDILRSLSRGRFVGFVLDQFMGPPIGLPVKFFGHLAGTTASLALLSEKSKVPILPGYSYRDRRGILHTVIEPPIVFPELSSDKIERLYQKTQIFNDILEGMVRKHPEQWLWLHRRWKPFTGELKWPLKNSIGTSVPTLAIALLVLLVGCTSQSPMTPTGIQLPPDPQIVVPKFEKEPDSFEESRLGETPPATPTPVPEPPRSKKKKNPKPEIVKKVMEPTPTPTPSPTPEVSSAFDVLPAYKIPFLVGERMELHLGWMGLPAGVAVMEVRQGQEFQGRKTFHLWGNILSSKLVDAIYHIDNTAESFVDTGGFIPYKFLLHMLETHQKKETRVSFDHLQKKAFYWSKRLSQKWGDESQDRQDDLIPGAKDLWSGVYYARTLDYKLNQPQNVYVYENGKNYLVELLPLKREILQTKVGAIQCLKIQVTIKLDNILRPTGDIFMWLSDDNKKYLVRFDAKIKIGSLYGNLVSVNEK